MYNFFYPFPNWRLLFDLDRTAPAPARYSQHLHFWRILLYNFSMDKKHTFVDVRTSKSLLYYSMNCIHHLLTYMYLVFHPNATPVSAISIKRLAIKKSDIVFWENLAPKPGHFSISHNDLFTPMQSNVGNKVQTWATPRLIGKIQKTYLPKNTTPNMCYHIP